MHGEREREKNLSPLDSQSVKQKERKQFVRTEASSHLQGILALAHKQRLVSQWADIHI